MNVFLTGGASGLGADIFEALSDAGHTVFFTFNQAAEAAIAQVARFPASRALHCDYADAASVASLLESIAQLPIDVLVNNALPRITPLQFQKSDVSGFAHSFQTHVIPVLQITQACLAVFRRQRSGKVITVLSSYLINRPPTGYAEYVANKAYLQAMSKSWAVENAKFGISVNCVSPSTMRTPLTADTDERLLETLAGSNPFARLVEPKEVADLVAYLVAAPQQLNSVNIVMNGGIDVI